MNLLYKYTTFENALKIIENNSFMWSKITDFNDPFESLFLTSNDLTSFSRMIAITISINKPILQRNEYLELISRNPFNSQIFFISKLRDLIKELHLDFKKQPTKETYSTIEKKIYNTLVSHKGNMDLFNEIFTPYMLSDISKKISDQSGILCLSKAKNHTLMWSHYAKNHTGIMFELDITTLKSDNSIYIHDVKYQDDVPMCSYSDLLGLNEQLFKSDSDNLFKKSTLTKSPCWSYEKEVRLLRQIKNNKRILPLPIKIFKSIYLGCKIQKNEKSKILEHIKKYSPDIDVFENKINKNKYQLEYYKLNNTEY
ncbi:DUF2971 domain-containing protein [Proteus terrae]|uniref:DUF2971 domain-containing protein n=2 Tax=Proteus terrae TaxID=1574161 RepID=UPI0032DAC41F